MIEFSQDTTLPLGDIMLKEMKYFLHFILGIKEGHNSKKNKICQIKSLMRPNNTYHPPIREFYHFMRL